MDYQDREEGVVVVQGAVRGRRGRHTTRSNMEALYAEAGGEIQGTIKGRQARDSFYKMYNKEIKVNQDEIPIILAELTDAAFNFI